MPNLARGSARSENSSGEQFGVASRAITPWIRDGSLIAAHNMCYGCYGLLCPESHNTITITVSGDQLGISVDPNNHQITNVVEGGAGDTAGLCVGDFIAEVNGKSTTGGSFGKLLPAAATAEIRLRLIRVQVVDPDHLHLPDLLA